MSSSDLIKNMLLDENGVFSAANSDLYHVTTGQALQNMRGWTNTGNMVLRGTKTTPYTVIAGLRYIIPALANFRFDQEFITWAKAQKRPDGVVKFDPDYLDSLAGMPFDVQIDMMPDGSIAFPGPIGRVTGDPIQAKWVDTIISDFLRRGSSIATKAARLMWAADGKVILADNAMRRSNDTAGLMTADIAYMCGMVGSSNMRAAMVGDYPAIGTMDHWYVMLKMADYFAQNPDKDPAKPDQERSAQQYAFRCFMKEHPDYGMLLIDTLGVEAGLEDAVLVLKEFNPTHYSLRIDSGDLARNAEWCSTRLKQEGLDKTVSISLSGGLRAVNMWSLVQVQNAPFTASGIGGYFQFGGENRKRESDLYEPPVNTEIVTKSGYAASPDQAQAFRMIKLSEDPAKSSRPGVLDRWRLYDDTGMIMADVEVDLTQTPAEDFIQTVGGVSVLKQDITSQRLDTWRPKTFAAGTSVEQMIEPMLRGPELVDEDLFDLKQARDRFEAGSDRLPEDYKRVDGSHAANPVGVEQEHYLRWQNMSARGQIISRI